MGTLYVLHYMNETGQWCRAYFETLVSYIPTIAIVDACCASEGEAENNIQKLKKIEPGVNYKYFKSSECYG